MIVNRLVLLLLLAVSVRAENVELTLRVETHAVTVTLGRGFAASFGGGSSTILDFDKRIRLDAEGDETPAVSSLYAAAGGRDVEMENRKFLAEVSSKAGVDIMPLVDSENGLSMLADPPATGIERAEKDGMVSFRWKKILLAEYSTEMLPATSVERKAFTRFLRHMFGGHPLLLDDLEKADGIPVRLRLREAVGGEERLIAVEKLERKPDAPYAVPKNAKLAITTNPKWGAAAARATAITPEAFQAHLLELAAAGDAAVTAGKPLDAFLYYMETYLTAGAMPAGFKEQRETILADEQVIAFRGAVTPPNAEEAKKALAVLEGFRKANPERAHVIRIFEANIHTSLGDPDKAFEEFLAVLTEQPALAGVWHDLGKLFLDGYDADSAWDCWTIARRLAPQHGIMSDVDTREAMLVATYPGFF